MLWFLRLVFFPVQWGKAKFDQRRLNRWLHLRQEGKPNAVALRKAWLSPKTTLKLLNSVLNQSLGTVGLMLYSPGGGFSSPTGYDNLTPVMMALAYLLPALPEDEQHTLFKRFHQLADHNWGAVRRAVAAALTILEREGLLEQPISKSFPK